MLNPINRAGQWFQTHKRRVMNRTGTTLVLGDIAALDTLGTATETAAGQGVFGVTGLDVQDAIFHNIVAVAAGNIDGPLVVVTGLLSGAGVDNTEVEVTLCSQRVQARVDGDTTDVAVGDRLEAVAAADNLRKLTVGPSIADSHPVAYALEANTGAIALKDVCFFGGLPPTTRQTAQGAAVADLGQDISATYVEAEVQAISDKVDALLAQLRVSLVIAT